MIVKILLSCFRCFYRVSDLHTFCHILKNTRQLYQKKSLVHTSYRPYSNNIIYAPCFITIIILWHKCCSDVFSYAYTFEPNSIFFFFTRFERRTRTRTVCRVKAERICCIHDVYAHTLRFHIIWWWFTNWRIN